MQFAAQPLHQRDEVRHFGRRGRDFGDGGELVVLDAALLEGLRRVDWGVVADVDDGVDVLGPGGGEDGGRVRGVLLAEGLEGAEAVVVDGEGDGGHGLPFREVLDVPFAAGGERLELPGHA